MMLLALLGVVLGGVALFGLAWWLERVTGLAGLGFALAAASALAAAGLGLARGDRLLPAVFVLQAVAFLHHAHWRRTAARTERAERGG